MPFIARWPGHIGEGTTTDRVINLVDLYATLAEGVGDRNLSRDEAPDSFSFWPTLIGKQQQPRKPMVCDNVAGILSVRDGHWKYIEGEVADEVPKNHHWRNPGYRQATVALYNLDDDPAEQENLAAKYPERVERMQAILDEYRDSDRSRQF